MSQLWSPPGRAASGGSCGIGHGMRAVDVIIISIRVLNYCITSGLIYYTFVINQMPADCCGKCVGVFISFLIKYALDH